MARLTKDAAGKWELNGSRLWIRDPLEVYVGFEWIRGFIKDGARDWYLETDGGAGEIMLQGDMEARFWKPSTDAVEGTLFLNDRERWQFNCGDREVELTCGSVLEIEAFGQWQRGRIEADSKGYLFLHDSGEELRTLKGRKARLHREAPRGGLVR